MPKVAFTPSEDQIAAIKPEDGPWEVEIYHRQFHYAPFETVVVDGPNGLPFVVETGGFAYARNGDVVSLVNHGDYVRGLRSGAFVDPTLTRDEDFGEGPGDLGARPDLVEYVKEHKTDDVLALAGSDPDIAQLLLDAENEAKPNNGEPRKGVLAGLQAVIDAYLDPATPADVPLTLADHAAAVASGTTPGSVPDPGDENEDGDGDHSEEE